MCDISMDRGRSDESNDTIFKVTGRQGQGHVTFKVAKMTIFKVYRIRHFEIDLGLICFSLIDADEGREMTVTPSRG